jgi:hypothetical protein
MACHVPKNFGLLATLAMPPQRVALPEVFPELQASMERRVRQLSDELSAACQKIIALHDCKRTEASMLAFLQNATSASHSHDSNRQIVR